MPTSAGSVFMDLRLNKNTFQSDVNSLGSFTKGVFTGMAQAAAAAFSVYALTKFISSSVDLASKLNEVQNVVDVTFGSSKEKINAFAKSAVSSFGLSEYAAKQYTGTMGAMLKSMGFTAPAAAGMSIEMAKLTGDMASFYNLSTDEAFAKIRAGISGEMEPLKQLGINLSVANLNAYALSKGLGATYDSMSQSNQSLLRYNYLLSITSDAQGDFARTSGGWANQTRVLKLNWESFMSTIGQGFIMLFTPIVQGINLIMPKLIQMGQTFANFISMVTGQKLNTTSVTSGLAAVSTGATEMATTAAKSAASAKRSLMGFDEINVLKKSSSSGSDGGAGLTPALTATTSAPSEAISQTQGEVTGFAKFLKENSVAILATLAAVGAGIATFFLLPSMGAFIAPLVAAIGWVQNFFLAVSNWGLLNTVLAGLNVTFGTLFSPIVLITAGVMAVTGAVAQLWMTNEGFKAAMIGAWNGIKDTFNKIWVTTLSPIFKSFVTMLNDIWVQGIQPLWTNFVGFVEQIGLLATDLWSFFKPIVDWFIVTFGPVIASVWGAVFNTISAVVVGVLNVFGNMMSFFGGMIENIRTIFSGLILFFTGVFSGDWSKAWDGIKTIFTGVWNSIKLTLSTIWNSILSIFSAGGKIFDGIVGAISDVFKTIVNSLISGINNVIAAPFNIINGLLNTVRSASILGVQPFKGMWSYNPLPVPQIPRFAGGAVIDSPTLGLMGEYPNAKRNPEIVSPQNIMYETFMAALASQDKGPTNDGNVTIQIILDGEILDEQIMNRQTMKLQRSNGRSAG